jgi:uncharacterized protein (TIRG00374 family)
MSDGDERARSSGEHVNGKDRGNRGPTRRLLSGPLLVQLAVAAVLIGLAAWQINFRKLGATFANANYAWLVIATGVYVFSRLVHAYEWRITLTRVGHVPIGGLFGALLIGTLVNAVVPASAGEVVKIQLVANRYGLPRAGLVAGRGAEAIVDAAIMTIFILTSFALPSVGYGSPELLWLLAGAAMTVFAGAVVASRTLPETFPSWQWLRIAPNRIYTALEGHWPRFAEGLEAIRRPRLLAIQVLLNLFGWGVDLIIFWACGEAFGLRLPFAAYLSVTVVIALITVFPITFGNVGTYEIAIISVLSLYAVSPERALAYAAGTHIFTTVLNVGLGVVAMWAMGVQPHEVFRLRRRALNGAASMAAPRRDV